MSNELHFPLTHRAVLVLSVLVLCSCGLFGTTSDDARTKRQKTEKPPVPTAVKPTLSDGVLAEINRRGELVVGMQEGFVPFEMRGKDGRLVGFDVDTARSAAKQLGVGLRLVKQDWGQLIPSLNSGTIDVIMSGMTVTSERNRHVVFTSPVLSSGRMFLVNRKNAQNIKKFEDLDRPGIFVVSGPGGLGTLRFDELVEHAAYREFPDRKSALEEVLSNRAQAYVDDEFAIRAACARYPDKLIGRFQPLTLERIAWAVAPGDYHWVNWLNNFIAELEGNGRLDELKRKWLRDYFLDRVGITE